MFKQERWGDELLKRGKEIKWLKIKSRLKNLSNLAFRQETSGDEGPEHGDGKKLS